VRARVRARARFRVGVRVRVRGRYGVETGYKRSPTCRKGRIASSPGEG
jgi:hypothetical protein